MAPRDCNEATIEFSSDTCNKDPCLGDETIPVDVTSKPIEEDDEGEEYCDEDETPLDDTVTIIPGDTFATSDSIEIDGESTSESTESSLITDDVMLSDSTVSDIDNTDASTDLPGNSSDPLNNHFINIKFSTKS